MAVAGQRFRSRGNPQRKMPIQTGVWNRKVNGQWVPWNPPSPVILTSQAIPYLKREATIDEIHRWPRIKEGGPFLNAKVELPSYSLKGVGKYDTGTTMINGFIQQYDGGFIPQWPWTGDEFSAQNYLQNLLAAPFLPSTAAYEPQVYPKLRPRLATASAGVFLAEMRDLPGMLRSTSKGFRDVWETIRHAREFTRGIDRNSLRRFGRAAQMAPKKAADHYLNQVFGWTPFLRDMSRFYDNFVSEGEKLARLTRDNGQWIKRKWVHEDINKVTNVASGSGTLIEPWGFSYAACCNLNGTKNHWTVQRVEKTLVWSEGSFKYYRPEFDMTRGDHWSSLSYLNRLITLYGLRVNPSVIYQATPWTWAIDWVTNVGDHIDMITDWGFDGVSARYAYLMHHRTSELVLTQHVDFRNGGVSLTWRRYLETKQRKEAGSPYGFTAGWESLTPRQIAIATALGISRA